jgi:hypothetical protein
MATTHLKIEVEPGPETWMLNLSQTMDMFNITAI